MGTHYSLLIDIGGTFIKSAILNPDAGLENILQVYIPDFNFNENTLIKEWDPNVVVTACRNLIDRQIQSNKNLQNLFITGQMGGWILTDQKNRPLSNLVSWQDSRGADFSNTSLSNDWFYATGGEVRPGLPLFGIKKYLTDSPSKVVRVHSLLSYIASCLVSDYQFLVHSSDYASTGIIDIYEHCILKECEDFLETKLDEPTITNERESIGNYQNTNLKVYAPFGDQQCSIRGVGINLQNIVVNIGTGGQVVSIFNSELIEGFQVRPYFQNKFIITKTHLPAGRLVTKLVENLQKVNRNIDFEWLGKLDLGTYKIDKHYDFNLDNLDNIIVNLKKTYSPEDIGKIVLTEFAIKYSGQVLKMNSNNDKRELKFAGGVANKLRNFSELIAVLANFRNVAFCNQETTLLGLSQVILESTIEI